MIDGRLPTPDEVIWWHRHCVLNGFSALLTRRVRRRRLARVIVTGAVLVDAHHTLVSGLGTGIQRVARKVLESWTGARAFLAVGWDTHFERLVELEIDGSALVRADRDVLIPWDSRYVLVELATERSRLDRMQALAAELCEFVPDADRDKVRSAARLAKADLSTGMVGEFPDLQGIMGAYYARHDGEHAKVADAIAEHYSPLGPSDACSSKPESVCVSLADKIDSLVGFWSIDEKPTGSKDPYALRRAALGVIRLIIENKLRLPLLTAFAQSQGLYGAGAGEAVGTDLLGFFADRLKVHLREQGVKHDHIDAVFALGGEDDLCRLLARVEALADFLGSDDGENLLTAYRRAANILKIEEKKDGVSYSGAVDGDLLREREEQDLFGALRDAVQSISAMVADEKFTDAMSALAVLRAPVDAFFDKVTVNADDADIRENRLKLLSMIRTALEGVADFSRIEG